MPSRSASSQCGRRPSRGSGSPQRADGDVRLLAADRDVRVGRVRDAEHRVVERGLDGRSSSASMAVDAVGDGGRRRLELGDLVACRIGAAAHGLADAPARVVALGLERVALGHQLAAPLVELERAVDEAGSSPLSTAPRRRRSGSSRSRCRPTLMPGRPPRRPRAGGRSTKSRSSAASSQPARGPELRPRNAR